VSFPVLGFEMSVEECVGAVEELRICPGSPGIDPQPGRQPSYATNTTLI